MPLLRVLLIRLVRSQEITTILSVGCVDTNDWFTRLPHQGWLQGSVRAESPAMNAQKPWSRLGIWTALCVYWTKLRQLVTGQLRRK